MKFGSVYRLRRTSGGEFIVMVIHPVDGESPMSMLLVNTNPAAPSIYLPGMVGNWYIYDADWERVDEDA